MLRSGSEWEHESWKVLLRMEVPYLAPCAVLCAIFAWDPVFRYDGELRRLTSPQVTARLDKDRADLPAWRAAAWENQFREITGDKMLLLADFGDARRSAGPTADSPALQTSSLLLGSSEPEGRRWLATKVLHAGGRLYCWCIPFEARRGHRTEVILRGTNVTDLGADASV